MKFSQRFRVRFSECDAHAFATPIAVFNYLQDTAIAHSRSAGRSREMLEERGLAWMMNRAHLEFDRFPEMDSEVTVRTWAHNLTGLFAIREWTIEDASGVCVRSTGRWILFDVRKMRIIKIPSDFSNSYGVLEERAVEDDFDRMNPAESFEFRREFHVRLSDLDTNRHANSGSYLDWMLEAAPQDAESPSSLRSVEITFKKESALGEGLCSGAARLPSAQPGQIAYHHTIRGLGDDTVRAIGYSAWREG